ncbi:MAG: sigma-70 family RNA polymerase sigma factor [Planctomycetota bacterium]
MDLEFEPSETLDAAEGDLERVARSAAGSARRAARPSDVEDVVQEALLASLNGAPAHIDQRSAWVRTVARRCAARMFRTEIARRDREVRYAEATDRYASESVPPEPDPALERALAGLSDEHRAVIDLHYGQGLSLAEIARDAGVPSSTVRVRHSRAIAQLRTSMGVPADRAEKKHGFGLIGLLGALRRRKAAAALAVTLPCAAVAVWAVLSAGSGDDRTVRFDVTPPTDGAVTGLAGLEAIEADEAVAGTSGLATVERTTAGSARQVHVLGRNFESIEGASIFSLESMESMDPVLVGVTDADGRATVETGTAWLFASHPGYGRSWSVLAESNARDWNLRLHPSGRPVLGFVRDEDGAPIPDALVRVVPSVARAPRRNMNGVVGSATPVFARTDARGAFELGVRDSWHRLEASAFAPGRAGEPVDFQRAESAEIVLRAARAGQNTVQLVDSEGTPLAGWSVFRRPVDRMSGDPELRAMGVLAQFSPLVTDGYGSFDLGGVRRAGLELVACAPDDMSGEARAARMATDVTRTWVVPNATGERREMLVSAPSGSEVYVSGARLTRPLRATPSGGASTLRVGPLPLGTVRLQGKTKAGIPFPTLEVDLVAGDGPQRVELRPLESRVFRVTVAGGEESGAAVVRVHALGAERLGGTYGGDPRDVNRIASAQAQDVRQSHDIVVPGPGPFLVCVIHTDHRKGSTYVEIEENGPSVVEVGVELRPLLQIPVRMPVELGRSNCAIELLDDTGRPVWCKAPKTPAEGACVRLPHDERASSVRFVLPTGETFTFGLGSWPYGDLAHFVLEPRSPLPR